MKSNAVFDPDTLQDLIYQVSPDGKVMFATELFARIFGYKNAREIIGMDMVNFYFKPQHREILLNELRRRGGSVTTYIEYLRKKDGTPIYLSLNCNWIDNDETKGTQGTGRDVTARVGLWGGFYQSARNGLITFCNDKFANIFGYDSPTELIGKNTTLVYKKPGEREHILRILGRNGHAVHKMEGLRKDSKEIFIEVNKHRIDDTRGNFCAIEGTVRDVSKQHRLSQELEESKEMYETLVARSTDGIYRLDENGVFDFVSKSLETMHGYSPGELIGKAAVDLVLPEYQDRVKEEISRKLAGEPRPPHEIKMWGKGGKLLTVRVDSQGVKHEGKPAILGYLRDITEEIERVEDLESEVKEATKQVTDTMELFIHELSAPVGAIRGTAEILELKIADAEILREFRKVWRRKASDILDLCDFVNMMIENVALAQRDKITPEHGRVLLLGDVIGPTVNFVKPLARNRRFGTERIEYDRDNLRRIPPLSIGRDHLRQVLFNILTNSIKYAYDDRTAFAIEINTKSDNKGFYVIIRDWGIGVPESEGQRIFRKHRKGSNAQEIPGKGLGMWVTKRILEAYSAEIRLINYRLPTEFEIFLPAKLTYNHWRRQ